VSGNVTDCPTDGDAGDAAPTEMPGGVLTLTVMVAGVTPVPVVPLPDAARPAVAVTLEVLLVASVVCALPF
jgi:hypothetical protein